MFVTLPTHALYVIYYLSFEMSRTQKSSGSTGVFLRATVIQKKGEEEKKKPSKYCKITTYNRIVQAARGILFFSPLVIFF